MKSRPYIRARDSDSLVGDVFGEPVLTEAEAEHRGKRPVEVELALLDLSEVLEEVRLRASRLCLDRRSAGRARLSPACGR